MFSNIRKWFSDYHKTIIRLTYIIPILFVAGISIAHVISWYSMTNPLSWAIYLSVGIEIAALSALAGMSVKNNKAVYVPFLIVTFIQFVGNMFFAFQYIDITTKLFKDWVTLVDPIFDVLGMNTAGNIDGHRRWLAIFGGALLPLISLSFLHLLVKFNDNIEPIEIIPINDKPKDIQPDNTPEPEVEESNEEVISTEIETNIKDDIINEPTYNNIVEIIDDEVNDNTEISGNIDSVEIPLDSDIIDNNTELSGINEGVNDEIIEPVINEYKQSTIDGYKPPIIEEYRREPVIPKGQIKREDLPEVKSGIITTQISDSSDTDDKKIFFRKKQ